jgi:hypothetical protein
MERLDKDPLPAVDRELNAASKAAQAAKEDPQAKAARSSANTHLAAAERRQQEVIEALERLVKDLSQGLGYDRFRRAISRIRGRQQQLQRSTSELARSTLAIDFEELTAGQRAALSELDREQVDLAQPLDLLELEMEAARATAERHDRIAAAKLADAVATSRGLAITGRMRETGRAVGRNHLGQAVSEQTRLVDDLAEVLERLRQSPSGPSQRNNQTAASDRPKSQRKPAAEEAGKPSGKKPGGNTPGGRGQKTTAKPGGAKAGQTAGRAPTGANDAGGQPISGPLSAKQLLGEVWGHLPPRARMQLMQWSDEQFLPKYEPLIEQYFQRLAEQPPPANR